MRMCLKARGGMFFSKDFCNSTVLKNNHSSKHPSFENFRKVLENAHF
jgi:hypothetical protein